LATVEELLNPPQPSKPATWSDPVLSGEIASGAMPLSEYPGVLDLILQNETAFQMWGGRYCVANIDFKVPYTGGTAACVNGIQLAADKIDPSQVCLKWVSRWQLAGSTHQYSPSESKQTVTLHDEITRGMSKTQMEEWSVEVSAGIEKGPVSIGATIGKTFGTTFEVSTQTTKAAIREITVPENTGYITADFQTYNEFSIVNPDGTPFSIEADYWVRSGTMLKAPLYARKVFNLLGNSIIPLLPQNPNFFMGYDAEIV
jgi:hypothetical protein